MCKIRILKVHSKFRARTWDNTFIPEIRLEGKWLEELGFRSGKQVMIIEKRNKLIITVKKEAKPPIKGR
jgi:toxic protein SymE